MQVEGRPTLLSRVVKAAILAAYRWKGWTIEGSRPMSAKSVILGAPHTSNWDFVFFLGAIHQLGLRPRFMGKTSLFRWPLTRFMHDMGGVPIDRSARANYVEQVVGIIRQAPGDFHLVIAPEGTRGPVKKWRSGFYHIALGAGITICPAWVDHSRMTGGIGPEIVPTGDYATDIRAIADFYRAHMPDHPKLQALYRMAENPDD